MTWLSTVSFIINASFGYRSCVVKETSFNLTVKRGVNKSYIQGENCQIVKLGD